MCIAFGLGENGAAWLDRLALSEWFSGLMPQPDDLVAAGGAIPAGRLLVRADAALCATVGIEATLARIAWPAAPVAAVAVSGGSGPAEQIAALGLVTALRARRDARGCRMAVVVTLEGPISGKDEFELDLLDRGAFVVRAGLAAEGDHVHHFPLRASTYPRRGRLVCVDLTDYLACWRPGSRADLHVIPLPFGPARDAIDRLAPAYGSVGALNLDLLPDLDGPENPLAELNQLASHCRERFLGEQEGNFVFTSSERLDGRTGTADLVVIAGRPSGPWPDEQVNGA